MHRAFRFRLRPTTKQRILELAVEQDELIYRPGFLLRGLVEFPVKYE
ncbi:hypothetical protein [Shimazuella kribbensis]|nr:hypothetical protein [Shimazuella kribbensis]